MKTIKYTNELGASITFKDYVVGASQYKLQQHNISDVDVESVLSKGYQQNGAKFKYGQGNVREIDITGLLQANSQAEMDEYIEDIKTVFNPFLGEGTLRYTNEYIDREITVKVIKQPIIPNFKNMHNAPFSIMMEAYDPFFYDLEFTRVSLVGVTDPYYYDSPSFTFEEGDTFTLGELSGLSNTITNDGHAPLPLTMYWTGTATNPKIELVDTGEFIQYDGSLTSDQRLIITTGYGNKKAQIETISTGVITDAPDINDESTFFSIPIGQTVTLEFSASSGATGSVVDIDYKRLWT